MLFFLVVLSHYCECRVEQAFPNQSFSRPFFGSTAMHCQLRFKLCRNYIFHFSFSRYAAPKKENNTDGIPIHFLVKSFLKATPSPLDPYNIDEKNQTLKLLLVTPVVDLVLYLDLWARKCSSFIFIIMSNTISAAARAIWNHVIYLS